MTIKVFVRQFIMKVLGYKMNIELYKHYQDYNSCIMVDEVLIYENDLPSIITFLRVSGIYNYIIEKIVIKHKDLYICFHVKKAINLEK
jgi:hypothetical protein